MTDDYSYLFEYKTRTAELQDIAAMDRMAAELLPQSALSRWAEQRLAQRREGRRTGLGRLFRHQARHAA